MMEDCQVLFCENARVKFPCVTRLPAIFGDIANTNGSAENRQ